MKKLATLFVVLISCEPMPGPAGQPGPAGMVGPEGPPGKSAMGVTIKNGSRLQQYASVISGADGFVQTEVTRIWDSELKAFCRLEQAVDGQSRCLPGALNIGNEFADDRCTVPAVAAGNPFPFAKRFDPPGTRIYAVDTVPMSTFWRSDGAACMKMNPGPGLKYFKVLDEIPAARLVAVKRVEVPLSM